ncbi:MAG: hypothetical protein POH28_03420 [Acidocella sp.]|nr:hypothetical protein [Acidocella sp.]
MSKAIHFQSALVSALADRDAARDEIFVWLRGLAPEERAQVPPEKFSRLTSEQFATLLGRAMPQKPSEAANSNSKPASDTSNWRKGRRAGAHGTGATKIRSPFHHAVRFASIVELCTGLAAIAIVYMAPYAARFEPPPVRQAAAATWPQCFRLTPSTDGCIYYVESTLTWPDAAQMLGMPLPVLLHANNASGTSPLAQGSPIIVWRFRRPLSN